MGKGSTERTKDRKSLGENHDNTDWGPNPYKLRKSGEKCRSHLWDFAMRVCSVCGIHKEVTER